MSYLSMTTWSGSPAERQFGNALSPRCQEFFDSIYMYWFGTMYSFWTFSSSVEPVKNYGDEYPFQIVFVFFFQLKIRKDRDKFAIYPMFL